MKVNLNGQIFMLEADQTLAEFLTARNYDPKRVAVMRNGEIVTRALFESQKICEDDELEVVSFVGGG